MEKSLTSFDQPRGDILAASEPSFNPIMLILAREAEGLTQSALAKVAGMPQGTLSRIENGLLQPLPAMVSVLASSLRVPDSLFYVPGRDYPLPLTFYRKRSRLGSRELRRVRARVNLARFRLETLLRGEEFDAPRLLQVDPRARGGRVEQVAIELRVHWGLGDGPVGNLTELLERFGVLIVPCDFGTEQIDALSIYEPNSGLPPMIFLKPTMSGDRMRLTLAHELAHIILHHHLGMPDDSADVEDEAWRFAAELLMPAKVIRGQLMTPNMARLAQLKVVWKVSMQALLKRAHTLGTISAREERFLWIQLGRAGKATEPVTVPVEQATRLSGIVRRFVGEYGYSVKQMSAILHQTPEQFRSQFLMQPTHLQLS